jgi:hypothetical protein
MILPEADVTTRVSVSIMCLLAAVMIMAVSLRLPPLPPPAIRWPDG